MSNYAAGSGEYETMQALVNQIHDEEGYQWSFLSKDVDGLEVVECLPEEIDPTYVLPTYFVGDGKKLKVRQSLVGLERNIPTEDLSKLYKAHIVDLKITAAALATIAEKYDPFGGKGLAEYMAGLVQKEGKRVIAAHVVGRVLDSAGVVSAVVYPRVIAEEVPIRLRDIALRTLDLLDIYVPANDIHKDMARRTSIALKSLLTLSESSKHEVTASIMSLVLPNEDKFEKFMAEWDKAQES